MNDIKLFESKEIRSTMYNGEWYFAVSDVVGILSESLDPTSYWRKLKQREPQLVTNCHGLKMPAPNGKMYKIDCANKEGLLRIIQSIPSKKAEPFKRWLANIGSIVLDERSNKRLAAHRKLKETEKRFHENIKDRGVCDNGFKRIIKSGDEELFNGTDMHEKYGIDKDSDIDDYMNTLLLHGKGFATEITNHHTTMLDLEGENDIKSKHRDNTKEVRQTLVNAKIKPEDVLPEKDLKQLKGGTKT